MSERIDDVLTPEGIAKLKKGQILRFIKARELKPSDYDPHIPVTPPSEMETSELIELKITKIDRKNQRVWAKPVKTFRADEIVVTNEKGNIFGRKKRRTIKEHLEEK